MGKFRRNEIMVEKNCRIHLKSRRDDIMVDVEIWECEIRKKSYEGNHNRAKGL